MLYSPRGWKGWVSLLGMLLPKLLTSDQTLMQPQLKFHSFFIWQLELGCQRGCENAAASRAARAHTDCHSTACWLIPTALYRARLLNTMFLEWERKGVFFFLPQNLPTPNLHCLFFCALPSLWNCSFKRSPSVSLYHLFDFVSIKAFTGPRLP